MSGYGYCECGCGCKTKLARQSVTARGQIKGQPVRFIKGHSGHKYAAGETAKPNRWREEEGPLPTACWVWLLYRNHNGYGIVMADGRPQVAHRFHYEQAHGSLEPRIQLDHLCRNRACVNPAHLEPVSNAENSQRGANSKLTPDDVSQIRGWLDQGWRGTDLAQAFGVTSAQISNIKHRKSWA